MLRTSDPATAAPQVPALAWYRSRFATRIAIGLLIALPVFLSFNFVYRFCVDVPYWDQWEFVPMLERSIDGGLQLGDVWKLHNEHRIVFPRLLMLVTARASGWDARADIYLNWLLLVAVGFVLLQEHLRAFGRSVFAWLTFLPMAWLIFSMRQWENLLWGWQSPIFLAVLSFVASAALIERSNGRPAFLVAAGACAVVSSFSLASGLGVWPAGFLHLLSLHFVRRNSHGPRYLFAAAAWALVAVVAIVVYFHGYEQPSHHPPPSFFTDHFGAAGYFALAVLGNPISAEPVAMVGGGVTFVVVGLVVAAAARARALEFDKATFAVPLLVFTGASAVMLVLGRAAFGVEQAAASRYATIMMLGVIGLYRAVAALKDERLKTLLGGLLLAVSLLGVVSAFDGPYAKGRQLKAERLAMVEILRDYRNRPDTELRQLYPWADVVKDRAAVLERHRLSVFRDGTPR